MSRVRVADSDEFDPGAKRVVDTQRGEIGVFNVDGDYYAVANTCAHQGGPVCEGTVHDDVGAEYDGVGERVTAEFSDRKVIKCPWHGWEYYLDSGDLAGNESVSLPTFEVVVEEGELYLEL